MEDPFGMTRHFLSVGCAAKGAGTNAPCSLFSPSSDKKATATKAKANKQEAPSSRGTKRYDVLIIQKY